MSDLIRRKDAIRAILDLQDYSNGFSGTYDKAYIIGTLEEVVPVDAVPVRHGRWTADESTYTDGEAQCSVCKTTFYVDDLYCVGEKAQSELPNYCPHCGAKMED